MNAEQIAFPFRARKPKRLNEPNADLIGRSYLDGHATITVVGVCLNDDKRVMVEHDLDGRAWSSASTDRMAVATIIVNDFLVIMHLVG